VEDLADAGGEVAVVAEVLGQERDAGNLLFQEPLHGESTVRTPAGQERVARRATQRPLAVGAVEPHALQGEPVDVGCFDDRAAVGADRLGVEVVADDEQDVGTLRLRVEWRNAECDGEDAVDASQMRERRLRLRELAPAGGPRRLVREAASGGTILH
jgi:hypothetical protein